MRDRAWYDRVCEQLDMELSPFGGIDYYKGMTSETARRLLDSGDADADDKQNEAPTFAEFVAWMEGHPTATAHGYVVGHMRDDARVTIEGLNMPAGTGMAEALDFASAFQRADELTRNEDGSMRCWYD